jgi:hypothetical protein
VTVDEFMSVINDQVREKLTQMGIPVWEVEPWPPPETVDAPEGARRAG